MKQLYLICYIFSFSLVSKGQSAPISVQDEVKRYLKYLQEDCRIDTVMIYGQYCEHGMEGASENAIVIYKNRNKHIIKAFDTYRGITDETSKYSEGMQYYLKYYVEIDSLTKLPHRVSSAHGSYIHIHLVVNNQVIDEDYFLINNNIHETKLWYLFKILDSEHFYIYKNKRYFK